MYHVNVRRAALSAACLAVSLLLSQPAIPQDYGDTPYVQTPQNVVEKMLEIAKVGPKDYVIDLGSGDGRMVITAAKKYGARGFGVDLDRRLVALANRNAAKAGVADRAVFYERDLHKTDVSRATVLTIYLLPEVNLMVRPKLLSTLKPGTRIVSHDYDMGEWTPELALEMEAPDKPVGRDFKSKVFYWVVPAKVAGTWRWQAAVGGRPTTFEVTFDQMFQKIDGTMSVDGRSAKILQGTLNGPNISFEAKFDGEPVQHYVFSGRVANDRITGQVRMQNGTGAERFAWKAQRTRAAEPAHMALKLPPPPPGAW